MSLIKTERVAAKMDDYFNEQKGIYDAVPVFPFLSSQTVKNEAERLITDLDALRAEVDKVVADAIKHKDIIADTNHAICLLDWEEASPIIQLLPLIREWAFRNDGGGVGELDFDQYDLHPKMKQLIIINPNYTHPLEVIVGGYRYMVHDKDSYAEGPVGAHFDFSTKCMNESWIELGRSFLNPFYQQTGSKASFDNVIHGLGCVWAKNLQAKGFFGKVTLYQPYEVQGADAFFLAVMKKYFGNSQLMSVKTAKKLAEGELTPEQLELLDKNVFKGLFLILRKQYKLGLVPIMAVYNRMTSLDKVDYFGAFRHKRFGNTTEVGIAIAYDDVYEVIREKFRNPYIED